MATYPSPRRSTASRAMPPRSSRYAREPTLARRLFRHFYLSCCKDGQTRRRDRASRDPATALISQCLVLPLNRLAELSIFMYISVLTPDFFLLCLGVICKLRCTAHSSRGLRLFPSPKMAAELADRFAPLLSKGTVARAALQGCLMTYISDTPV
ncbi:hypothetical protein K466DRAFT_588705 [Polyporus arcularius HHB13444]|uniref:Uncharacterized protein n=1 Tax=Polyporus arcularius HHB13444 TaxID=1314778 RepID=A0A5C3P4Y0_9APHY|nr:hypothetical protein K466DRAFT_588705 [Polyporus arcularius HHB13444]